MYELATDARVHDIIRKVAARHGYTAADLLGRGQGRAVSAARHEAMFEARKLGVSFTVLAKAFRRDHKTVLAAVKKLGGGA